MDLAVLIPSYNRPEILNFALDNWLAESCIHKVVVVAEGSSKEIFAKYQEILLRHQKSGRLIYKLSATRLGSVNARNILLKIANKCDCDFIVMADDDYLPPPGQKILATCKILKANSQIGAIGGRVIVKNSTIDGDFFLNTPFSATADILSKFTGYIFLDVKHGPRYTDYLSPFFILKKQVAKNLSYDILFDTPTAFREESDFQVQIRSSHYKLFFDPNLEVIHLAISTGGNRSIINMKDRIYWKARNCVIFNYKWTESSIKRFWYTFFCTIILSIYRPWNTTAVLKGTKDGIHIFLNLCNRRCH